MRNVFATETVISGCEVKNPILSSFPFPKGQGHGVLQSDSVIITLVGFWFTSNKFCLFLYLGSVWNEERRSWKVSCRAMLDPQCLPRPPLMLHSWSYRIFYKPENKKAKEQSLYNVCLDWGMRIPPGGHSGSLLRASGQRTGCHSWAWCSHLQYWIDSPKMQCCILSLLAKTMACWGLHHRVWGLRNCRLPSHHPCCWRYRNWLCKPPANRHSGLRQQQDTLGLALLQSIPLLFLELQ